MNIVFMGSPEFAVPALEKLVEHQYNVVAVYTQPDKLGGRGHQVISCPVKRVALAKGLNVIQPGSFKDDRTIEQLRELSPDLIVIAAYGRILPDAVLEMPHYRCINIHPSLLPKYRGPSPIAAAILNGDEKTGVTIMLVEQKVDSGPILMQQEMRILNDDTLGTLSARLAKAGADLLIETIPGWTAGKIQPAIQDESQASHVRKETKDDSALDWQQPAERLWRQVRAYHPWPGSYTKWKTTILKINQAVALKSEGEHKTGEVILLPKTYPARVAVQTGDGLLGLITVQPEGKREMSGQEFIAGHRDFPGSIL